MLHKFREAPARASFLYSLHTSFARGLPMAVKCLATVSVAALMCEAPVQAQGIVRAEFSRGAIAEYTNNPNGTDRGILFSTLNITGFTITQSSANGQWGGTQGNDTAVTATIMFSDGTSTSFPAAINWVKNAGSGSFDWVGLTIASGAVVKDGYTPSAGYLKTYVLQFPKSTLNLSSLLPNGLDGSANTGAALSALNQNFPNATPPVITGPPGGTGSSSSAVSVNENQSAVTTLSADKAVSWAITGGADAARFSIGANGAITFNAAPDFETPVDADANNVYLVTVRATDGNGNTASQSIAVTVLDLDDTAPLLANQSFAYAENQTAGARVGTVAASDEVGVTGFRFSATGTQTSADGFFAIDASGAITLTPQGAAAGAATNDFEIAPNSFTYQVGARDAAGNWSKPADVTLAVTDIVDNAPVITGPDGSTGDQSTVSVSEGTTIVATLTTDIPVSSWAIIGGNDKGRFEIDAEGRITFVLPPDFEAPSDADGNNTYILTVEAIGANGGRVTQTLTVTVTDVADTPPVITGPDGSTGAVSATSVPEGTSTVATLSADVSIARWAIVGGNDKGLFAIDAGGQITFVAAPDFETPTDSDGDNVYVLTVEAVDEAGNRVMQTVSVTVTDVADTPPVILGPDGKAAPSSVAITVDEGATAVARLSANMPVASWAITAGDDRGLFAISNEGTITFNAAPDFDAPADSDADNVYTLSVTATDANGLTATQLVTVTVADLQDSPPVITGPDGSTGAVSATSVPEGTSTVAALSADVAIARWAIVGGNDKGLFAIDGEGQITFVAAPDFEAPTDSDGDNVYVLTVEAVDEAGNRVTHTVSVTVTDVADSPPVILGSDGMTKAPDRISVDEGTLVVTRLTANVPISAWSITGGNDKGRFAIDASGVISFTVAPDFDEPVDSDGDNIYVLVIEGVDADGNRTQQTLTVIVNALPDTAPVITGPSGEPGAASAMVTIEEALTLVTRLSADVAVEWAIVDGDDRDQFAIDENGTISFRTAPDFEAPTDRDRNNAYLIVVQAQADDGSTAFQSITITVTNVDEIGRKIEAISPALRSGLRNHAFASLATMVSFNENLLGLDEGCTDTGRRKPVSGGVDADEERQEAGLQYARELSACNSRTRFYVDGGGGPDPGGRQLDGPRPSIGAR